MVGSNDGVLLFVARVKRKSVPPSQMQHVSGQESTAVLTILSTIFKIFKLFIFCHGMNLKKNIENMLNWFEIIRHYITDIHCRQVRIVPP